MQHTEAVQIAENAIKCFQVLANGFYNNNKPQIEMIAKYNKSKIAGKAHIGGVPFGKYQIELNIPLLAVNDDNDKIFETVGHEIAHLVAFDVYNDCGHGKMWKHVMRQFSLTPNRCHRMHEAAEQVGKKKKNTKQYIYECNSCGAEIPVGPKRHKNQQSAFGRRYNHKCKGGGQGELTFVGESDRHTVDAYQAGQRTTMVLKTAGQPVIVNHGDKTYRANVKSVQQKQQQSKSTSGNSKIDQCRDLFDSKATRKANITCFVNRVGLSQAAASTYYQKIKNEQ